MFVLVGRAERRLVNISRVNCRLHRQQKIIAGDHALVVAERNAARGLELFQRRLQFVQNFQLGFGRLVTAFRGLLRAFAAPLDGCEIGQR